ncbi:MAG: hypothetical protein WCI67_10095 [Chloroflexales bacterium]
MICVRPPELDERELIAFVDGDATARVREHLAQCPFCMGRAEDLADIAAGLRVRLYRLDCPPVEDLGDMRLGVIAGDQRAALESHTDHCPHCRRELAQLDSYLDSLAAELEPGIVDRVKVLIARLIRGGPTLGMATVGVRGDGDEALLYEAGDTQLAIEILPSLDSPGLSDVFGLVSGGDMASMTIRLLRSGQLVAAADVDSVGNFVLADLDPGSYELTLRGLDVEVQVPDLRIT